VRETSILIEMDLEAFILAFNKPGSIILLEGKRVVLPDDSKKLVQLGKLLAQRLPLVQFRSGNAQGADECFAQGVITVDSCRFHVIIPDSKHRQRSLHGITYYSLDDIPLASDHPIIYEARKHKPTSQLVDLYLKGFRDRTTHRIAPIIRDAVKVLGTEIIPSATVGFFYDDLSNPMSGGTGFTMLTCTNAQVPCYDQTVWFNWL